MRLRGKLRGDGAAGVGIPTGTSGVAGFAAAGVLIFRAAVAGPELPERRRRRRRELAACNSAYSKGGRSSGARSEEHTSELQSHLNLVCRLLLEKKKTIIVNKLT